MIDYLKLFNKYLLYFIQDITNSGLWHLCQVADNFQSAQDTNKLKVRHLTLPIYVVLLMPTISFFTHMKFSSKDSVLYKPGHICIVWIVHICEWIVTDNIVLPPAAVMLPIYKAMIDHLLHMVNYTSCILKTLCLLVVLVLD